MSSRRKRVQVTVQEKRRKVKKFQPNASSEYEEIQKSINNLKNREKPEETMRSVPLTYIPSMKAIIGMASVT